MEYSFLAILILLGAAQGLISSFLLFRTRRKKPANGQLGWILLLLSLACLNIFFLETLTSWTDLLLILSYSVPLIILMPLGPLVYSYALTLTHGKPPQLTRWHFYPILLDVFPNVLAVGFFIGLAAGMVQPQAFQPLDAFTDHYNKYVDLPRWLSLTLYTLVAYRLVRTHRHIGATWPRNFLLSFLLFQVIWLAHLIPYLTPGISDQLLARFSWYPIYLPLVVLIYWMGFNGLLQTRTSVSQTINDPAAVEQVLSQLQRAMEEAQLYKKADLRLEHLVEHTGIPQKKISASLNQVIGKSFNAYVNEFRVREVQRLLGDARYDHLTLSAIGLESGFNSQATFQRVFKQLVKETPKQYQARIRNAQI